jgi:hypothetical protein
MRSSAGSDQSKVGTRQNRRRCSIDKDLHLVINLQSGGDDVGRISIIRDALREMDAW